MTTESLVLVAADAQRIPFALLQKFVLLPALLHCCCVRSAARRSVATLAHSACAIYGAGLFSNLGV